MGARKPALEDVYRASAGTNVYVWDAIEHLQVLVHARRTVDVAGLSDPNTSHASLLSELTTAD